VSYPTEFCRETDLVSLRMASGGRPPVHTAHRHLAQAVLATDEAARMDPSARGSPILRRAPLEAARSVSSCPEAFGDEGNLPAQLHQSEDFTTRDARSLRHQSAASLIFAGR
jgi:hypothetical protein